MSRKLFSHRNLALLLVTWLLLTSPCASAAPSLPENKASLQVLTGLDRHYNLSFLWFDRLAVGQLSFSRDPSAPNRYRAVLSAKTLGVAAWLTSERVQRYETLMEMTPQGRLRPLKYSSMIHKKKSGTVTEHAKLYTFDATTNTIMLTRSKDGKRGIEKPVKLLCDHCPVDFLTAGFNFILGADGPLQVGERKEIFTFTDKGESTIVIEVLSPKFWPETPFFSKGSGTLLKITLPPEILETGGGAVYAFLDKKALPQRVIVENVLGLGDVRGEYRP